jgi:hypothetical protein
MKKKLNIEKLLTLTTFGKSKWELDNIIWSDRMTNPDTLRNFLKRIQELSKLKTPCEEEKSELVALTELAQELNEDECIDLLSNNDEVAQQNFIETIARRSALEVLTMGRSQYETMNLMCKLSPSDFILASKRTQEIINSVTELVIQGESLSSDVPGA